MKVETRIVENHTQIPDSFMKKYDFDSNDVIIWNEDENGIITVKFRKKLSLRETSGIIDLDGITNSVEIKRNLYKRNY